MLTVIVLGTEYFDNDLEEFVSKGDVPIQLEHSLVSLSKWEQIFEKPFLAQGTKSEEELSTYVRCMALDPNIPPEVFGRMSKDNVDKIQEYIDAKMTATWFAEQPKGRRSQEVVTAELVYYWMITFGIPMECQYWHLNRLFTLIQVFNHKNQKPKKMSPGEVARRNRELNEQRKSQLGTSG